MENLIYNIPVEIVSAFRGRKVIVRSSDAAALVHALPEKWLDEVLGVQLLSPYKEADILARWGYAIPVEIVMQDPAKEFALLYRFARLLDKHPIRVSIPVVHGLEKAVRVATSLQFLVKLELGQPDKDTVDELLQALDLYLHLSSVSQPVEPFNGLLKTTLNETGATLWDIQEEDPSLVRFVLLDGRETIARPPFLPASTESLMAFTSKLQTMLLSAGAECATCPYLKTCGCYFKWTRPDFPCVDVKRLFGEVESAAQELKRDLETFDRSQVEASK
jgi:hypothetical protein